MATRSIATHSTQNQAETITETTIQRIYVDRSYCGHDYSGQARVMIAGQKRGLTPTRQRELKRRSAIEPMIGHAKNNGQLGRNHLLGGDGDKINALLAAPGLNLRLILNRLRRFLRLSLGLVTMGILPHLVHAAHATALTGTAALFNHPSCLIPFSGRVNWFSF